MFSSALPGTGPRSLLAPSIGSNPLVARPGGIARVGVVPNGEDVLTRSDVPTDRQVALGRNRDVVTRVCGGSSLGDTFVSS